MSALNIIVVKFNRLSRRMSKDRDTSRRVTGLIECMSRYNRSPCVSRDILTAKARAVPATLKRRLLKVKIGLITTCEAIDVSWRSRALDEAKHGVNSSPASLQPVGSLKVAGSSNARHQQPSLDPVSQHRNALEF